MAEVKIEIKMDSDRVAKKLFIYLKCSVLNTNGRLGLQNIYLPLCIFTAVLFKEI